MTASQFSFDSLVDWHQPTLYYSLGMIFFNPLFWNIAAQNGMSTLLAFDTPVIVNFDASKVAELVLPFRVSS